MQRSQRMADQARVVTDTGAGSRRIGRRVAQSSKA